MLVVHCNGKAMKGRFMLVVHCNGKAMRGRFMLVMQCNGQAMKSTCTSRHVPEGEKDQCEIVYSNLLTF